MKNFNEIFRKNITCGNVEFSKLEPLNHRGAQSSILFLHFSRIGTVELLQHADHCKYDLITYIRYSKLCQKFWKVMCLCIQINMI